MAQAPVCVEAEHSWQGQFLDDLRNEIAKGCLHKLRPFLCKEHLLPKLTPVKRGLAENASRDLLPRSKTMLSHLKAGVIGWRVHIGQGKPGAPIFCFGAAHEHVSKVGKE